MRRLFTFVLTIALFFGYPACHCPDFYLMSGIDRIGFYDGMTDIYLGSPGEVTTDDLIISVLVNVDAFTGSGSPASEGFMTSAMAVSPCNTHSANRITAIRFFSNHQFNDIPAGESLNGILFNADYNVTADQLPDMIYIDMTYDFDLNFRFLEKPEIAEHTFSVEIIDNSGNVFDFTADPLIWH